MHLITATAAAALASQLHHTCFLSQLPTVCQLIHSSENPHGCVRVRVAMRVCEWIMCDRATNPTVIAVVFITIRAVRVTAFSKQDDTSWAAASIATHSRNAFNAVKYAVYVYFHLML